MTTFENLELIYKEFLSLSDSIVDLCVNKDDIVSAMDKIESKNSLMQKLINARRTASLSEEQETQINILHNEINKKEESILKFLRDNKIKVKEEIDRTKKRVRVSSAYVVPTLKKQGVYVDVED